MRAPPQGGSKVEPKLEKRGSGLFKRKSTRVDAAVLGKESSTAIIGPSVVELAERDGKPVATLVEECIAFLLKSGCEEPGIFRVSGDKTQIQKLGNNGLCGVRVCVSIGQWLTCAFVQWMRLRAARQPLWKTRTCIAWQGC